MTLPKPAIALLCLISGFLPLITDGFLAAVRPLMTDFAVPLATAQGSISIVLLGCACAQLIVGALADRYGRRPVLIGSMLLFLAASAGLGMASSLKGVFFFRFLQGASAASGPILARAIVRDVYGHIDGARMLSLLAMGLALVPLLVPSLNGLTVPHFGWRSTAVLYVCVVLCALGMTLRWLPETLPEGMRAPLQLAALVSTARAACANRRVLGYILCCVTGYAGLAVWVSASPHLINGWYGRPLMQFGLYWSLSIVAYLAGGWCSVWLLRRQSPDRTLRDGGVILVLAAGILLSAGYLQPHSLALLLCGVCTYSFGWSMLQPNAQSGALSPFRASAGRISALLGFLQLSGGAAVAQLFGRLHDGSPHAAVGLMGGAAITHVLLRRTLCPLRSSMPAEA